MVLQYTEAGFQYYRMDASTLDLVLADASHLQVHNSPMYATARCIACNARELYILYVGWTSGIVTLPGVCALQPELY